VRKQNKENTAIATEKVEEIATETKTIATDAVETVSEKPVN
jgi:hypothetical protein